MIKRIAKKESINKLVNWVDGEAFKIIESGKVAQVTVEEYDPRSDAANRRYHAMIGDIHAQAMYKMPGKIIRLSDYDSDQVKALLIMWFAIDLESMGEPLKKPPRKVIDPFTGESYTVRPSSTDFDKQEAGKFIEWLYATGAETGVRWSEPALKEYETHRGAQR